MSGISPRYQLRCANQFLPEDGVNTLEEAGRRVLALRAVGYDAHVFDSITGLPVPEEAYAK